MTTDTKPVVEVQAEIIWATGPNTDALLRRLGLDPDFLDEQRVVVGRVS